MSFEFRTWIGLAGLVALGASVAWAQDGAPPSEARGPEARGAEATSPPPRDSDLVRHRCRLFATDLEQTVDTWDRSTDLGQWVLSQQDAGWRVDDVEISVARKSTGFVQAWTQVCLVPRTTSARAR